MTWIRTVSGRIVLGIVVLWTTFTVVGGYSIFQMNQLGRRLRFIRTTYLELSPSVQQLQFRAGAVADVLEGRLTYGRALMLKNREVRDKLLGDLKAQQAGIQDVPPNLRPSVEAIGRQIDDYARLHAGNAALFDQAFPLAPDQPGVEEARSKLRTSEQRLEAAMRDLHRHLLDTARRLTAQVERAERYARLWALGMGALATAIAGAVTVWAVVTLRPLRRLAAGARRIARGDYQGRVDAAGGTEVAELAREFNAMAAAIEEREQELVRSERLAAVGKMAAVITHEVRNPLSSIGLNTELLDEELGKITAGGSVAEARGLLASVQKEVDRLTGITEEYLRFARLPRPKLGREQVDDLVRELCTFQRGELEARGVKLELALGGGLPPVAADEQQLRQALINLLRNAGDAVAAKAGQPGGTVRLTTRRGAGGGTVEILVADDGAGIPAEHLPRLFEPFFSTKEGGTGLGLALTQQIVAEHGGKITVASSEQGTTFTIELPIAA